jgi:hypothetical protein
MTSSAATTSDPSPQRARVGLAILLFGLFGAPGAWFVQLVASYAVASRACFPHMLPYHNVPQAWSEIWYGLLAINIAALCAALICAFTSYKSWTATQTEQAGTSTDLVEIGEGRTRFIALSGVIVGIGFFAAILFDSVVLFTVPPCAG